MAAEAPECDTDDCTNESAYLLAGHGDLCEDCAVEKEPETVAYLRATLGTPGANGGESA